MFTADIAVGPSVNHIEDFLSFEFKEFILSAISSFGKICGIKLEIVKSFVFFPIRWWKTW